MPETRSYMVIKDFQPEGPYKDALPPDDRLIKSDLLVEGPGLVIEQVYLTPEEATRRGNKRERPHIRRVVEEGYAAKPRPVNRVASSRISAQKAREIHGITALHQQGITGEGEVVAILDTGISRRLADELRAQGRLVAAESMIEGEDAYDDDGGHGPWCIKAIADAAPGAKIISIKVLSAKSGSGSTSGIIKGVRRAVALGATVTSNSYGGPGDPEDAMSETADWCVRQDVAFVAAAGNEQDERPNRMNADEHHPGCAALAMTVAAFDSDLVLARFSSWGKVVDVAGLGVLIEVWGYVMSGTSMSTPHVAAIVALLRSAKRDLALVTKAVYAGAKDTAYEAFKEGHGFLFAPAALAALGGPEPTPGPGPTPTPDPATPAQRMLELHNRAREARGISPLKANADLAEAALSHSKEMVEKDYFSHDSANGEPFTERLKRAGYEYQRAGENIAWSSRASVERIFAMWMNSPGHKRNILNPAFKEVGFGLERGEFKGRTVRMWTADLGHRSGEAGATGEHEEETDAAYLDGLSVAYAIVQGAEDLAEAEMRIGWELESTPPDEYATNGGGSMEEETNIGTAATTEERCEDCGERVAKKPETPGGGKGGKGKLKQAHVFHGTVVSHDLDSVILKVEKYNRSKKSPLAAPEVDVFVSSTTNIVVGDAKGTIDSLTPGLTVVAVCRAQADGSFVARNVVDDAPEED